MATGQVAEMVDNDHDQESESSAGARDGDYSWVTRFGVHCMTCLTGWYADVPVGESLVAVKKLEETLELDLTRFEDTTKRGKCRR